MPAAGAVHFWTARPIVSNPALLLRCWTGDAESGLTKTPGTGAKASGLVDGVPFGWNIGYGFGDTSAATENMLFYNGKAHKLHSVQFHIPMKRKNIPRMADAAAGSAGCVVDTR